MDKYTSTNASIIAQHQDLKLTMLLSLHDKYTEENQQRMSTMVAIVIPYLAVIGYYGYVLLHSSDKLVISSEAGQFTSLAVVMMAIGAMVVILGLHWITLQIGIKCRREQFIAYAIRKKIFDKNENLTDSVGLQWGFFPESYVPEGKSLFNYLPNIYNDFVVVYYVSVLLLCITALCRLAIESCPDLWIITISGTVLILISMTLLLLKELCSYKRAEEWYKNLQINKY